MFRVVCKRAFSSDVPFKMRRQFTLPKTVNRGNWFPQHMYVGMKNMQRRLSGIDCVIEVHDARIPFCGRNPNFLNTIYAIRPHILVLNKVDLLSRTRKAKLAKIDRVLKEEIGIKHVLWTNCKHKQHHAIRELLAIIIDEVQNAPRYNREIRDNYLLMVIGVPNVGKSSLINAFRSVILKKKAANPIGPRPGVTRHVLERVKINETPPVYILDTPGVLSPDSKDTETAMKLAVCETVLQTFAPPVLISDFLLYWLNKSGRSDIVIKELGLSGPTDDIMKCLMETCIHFGLRKRVAHPGEKPVMGPDIDLAAEKMLALFRQGRFGDQFMDDELLEKYDVSGLKNTAAGVIR